MARKPTNHEKRGRLCENDGKSDCGDISRDETVPHRQHQEAQHVVNDRCPDDRPRGVRLQLPRLSEDIRGDGDARCGQGRCYEDGAPERKTEEKRDKIAQDPRDNDAAARDQRVPGLRDVLQAELQADDEQQDHGSQVRNTADKVSVGNDPQHAGSNEEPNQDFADDRGLVHAGGKQVSGQRDEEEKGHLELDEGSDVRHPFGAGWNLSRYSCTSIMGGRSMERISALSTRGASSSQDTRK